MILLHVERDFNFCRRIKAIVERNGFIYINAFSYDEAYKIILKGEVDLLIVAESVDEKSCKDLIQNIKLLEYPLTSVIVISEEYDYEQKAFYFDLGIMSYLSKHPFKENRFEQYIRTVRQALELLEELRTLKIAVVDDSSFSISLVKRYFDMHKIYSVDYFQDSEEFLNCKKAYDIYLLDYVMPKFDGEDLIYQIREEYLDSMIILLTGHDNQKTIAHCLGIGADDYILKPLDEKLFMLRIISCLHKLKIKKENIQNNQMLFKLATRDQLTGLYNRNYFVDMYTKKIHESLRTKQALSFILVDIDKFKNINDRYGHLKGDYVLKSLANILRENLRATDIICRWGGEEFLIMCIDTDLDKAIFVAQKIRRATEQYLFEGIEKVTISLGVTQWKDIDKEDDVFKRADNSLYLAKLTGRNRVVFEETVVFDENVDSVINIEWGAFFESGNPIIDIEHSSLIRLVNEIIYNCTFKRDKETLKTLFNELIFDSKVHFKSEEEILEKAGYEFLKEHKQIHMELMEKVLKLRQEFQDGIITDIDLAKYLIQDFVIGHIIKDDFKFFDSFLKRR